MKNLLTLVFVFFFSISFIYADSDGVWHEVENIRGGTFGTDEVGVVDFTFIDPLNVNAVSRFNDIIYVNNSLAISGQFIVSNSTLFTNSIELDSNADSANFLSIDSGSSSSQYSGIDFSDRGSAIWSIGKDNLGNFYVDEAGVANRLSILSGTGNVGIGTLAPSSRLYVDGAVTSTTRFQVGANEVWHADNDGPGSGLDSDQLDGFERAYFIEGISTGSGITGGGSGNLVLGIDTSYLQQRVSTSCPTGSAIRAIASDGSVTCETDDAGIPIEVGIGDVDSITTGYGLTGGASFGSVTISVDTSQGQQRISSTCPSGQAIRQVNSDGSVVCESTGGGLVSSGSANYLPLTLADGSLGNSNIYNNLGVGIGVTNPSQALDVVGKVRVRSQTVDSDSSDILTSKGYVLETRDDLQAQIDKKNENSGGRWSAKISNVGYISNGELSWGADEFLCGIRLYENCDFYSTSDTCLEVKLCSSSVDVGQYSCSFSSTIIPNLLIEQERPSPVCPGGQNADGARCSLSGSSPCYYNIVNSPEDESTGLEEIPRVVTRVTLGDTSEDWYQCTCQ